MAQYAKTTATIRISKLKKRIRAICGGTSASKTISILLYLIAKAQSDTKKTLTSVVSESIPHLKRGAIRDFKNILQGHNYQNFSLDAKFIFLWITFNAAYAQEFKSGQELMKRDSFKEFLGRLLRLDCEDLVYTAIQTVGRGLASATNYGALALI